MTNKEHLESRICQHKELLGIAINAGDEKEEARQRKEIANISAMLVKYNDGVANDA